jgi:hypothetical protein
MTDDAKDRRALATCWGIFDIDGNWHHNPFLKMSADEQRRENIEAGFMTTEGKRIKLPLPVDRWQN